MGICCLSLSYLFLCEFSLFHPMHRHYSAGMGVFVFFLFVSCLFFRGNCSICSCRFSVSMDGGEFRILVHNQLGLEQICFGGIHNSALSIYLLASILSQQSFKLFCSMLFIIFLWCFQGFLFIFGFSSSIIMCLSMALFLFFLLKICWP